MRSVQEMLSSAAGVRGQSLIQEARGHHSRYMEGLLMLQNSIRSEHHCTSQTDQSLSASLTVCMCCISGLDRECDCFAHDLKCLWVKAHPDMNKKTINN